MFISEGSSESNKMKHQVFNDPLPVRAKGFGKRLIGGKEKAIGNTKDTDLQKVKMTLHIIYYRFIHRLGSLGYQDTTQMI
ncbi:hypothetical protein Dsin_013218 [Dipteronia sinensis]|uniref:Uncharacterized protein n=1 Tax=Dipteronia sinensis TaxID=43782 RepID=A0AAE0E8P4_9ROSI|nr:hypothetical protein Dsin_013218 [Dipteronia sinensis]